MRGFWLLLVAVLAVIGLGVGAESRGGVPPPVANAASPIYQPPVQGREAYLSECPNPKGLEAFTPVAIADARQIANVYGHQGLDAELAESDPAWWPTLKQTWRQGGEAASSGLSTVWGSSPAIDDQRRGSWIGHSCGVKTQRLAELVVLGPAVRDCVACATEMFFVDRSGRVLLFWIGL